MATKERTRKVFEPILVVDTTKKRFNKKKGNLTADEYVNKLMDK